jgi:hypothetical protein
MCTDDACNESTRSCENPAADCLASGDPCAVDACVESRDGCQFSCGATLDTWWNVSGASLDDLKIAIDAGVGPSATERLGDLLQMGSQLGLDADHGSRMTGWLVPPMTGEYIFWIIADHPSELWLSSDDDPKNAIMLCRPLLADPVLREGVYSSQRSKSIALVADRAYYFEVRGAFLVRSWTHSLFEFVAS